MSTEYSSPRPIGLLRPFAGGQDADRDEGGDRAPGRQAGGHQGGLPPHPPHRRDHGGGAGAVRREAGQDVPGAQGVRGLRQDAHRPRRRESLHPLD
eukprot:7061759-Pyramimonas_sp.AAC.1